MTDETKQPTITIELPRASARKILHALVVMEYANYLDQNNLRTHKDKIPFPLEQHIADVDNGVNLPEYAIRPHCLFGEMRTLERELVKSIGYWVDEEGIAPEDYAILPKASRHYPQISIFVDGKACYVDEIWMTPVEILQAAGVNPETHYLVKLIYDNTKASRKIEEKIEVYQGACFLSIDASVTPQIEKDKARAPQFDGWKTEPLSSFVWGKSAFAGMVDSHLYESANRAREDRDRMESIEARVAKLERSLAERKHDD